MAQRRDNYMPPLSVLRLQPDFSDYPAWSPCRKCARARGCEARNARVASCAKQAGRKDDATHRTAKGASEC
jgi:hypothetical protein